MGSDEGQQDSERGMGIDLKCGEQVEEMMGWRVRGRSWHRRTKHCLYDDGHVISGYILGKLARQRETLRRKCWLIQSMDELNAGKIITQRLLSKLIVAIYTK